MTNPDILDVQVTENDIVNTTTETDLWTYSVPANTLGTNKAIRVMIRGDYLDDTASTTTWRFRIYYGTTLMFNDLSATLNQNTARRPWVCDLYLWARSATNSQGVAGNFTMGNAGGATTGIADFSTDEILSHTPIRANNASEDSTTTKTFKVTIAHTTADPNMSLRRLYAIAELISL